MYKEFWLNRKPKAWDFLTILRSLPSALPLKDKALGLLFCIWRLEAWATGISISSSLIKISRGLSYVPCASEQPYKHTFYPRTPPITATSPWNLTFANLPYSPVNISNWHFTWYIFTAVLVCSVITPEITPCYLGARWRTTFVYISNLHWVVIARTQQQNQINNKQCFSTY